MPLQCYLIGFGPLSLSRSQDLNVQSAIGGRGPPGTRRSSKQQICDRKHNVDTHTRRRTTRHTVGKTMP